MTIDVLKLLIDLYLIYVDNAMFPRLINLTSLFVLREIDEVLLSYPSHPHQAAFSVPYWKQRLMSYVLNNVTNRYMVMEKMQDISRDSGLFKFPIEEILCIENIIHKGILILLENNPNWQDYQDFTQELPMDALNLIQIVRTLSFP